MISTLLAVNLLFSPAILAGGESRHFPSGYYNETQHLKLHRKVLRQWPGPDAIAAMWSEGDLTVGNRVTLLLGASAFHDPDLLPVYIDAIDHDNVRIRQAAAYGYRKLIADRSPNVSSGITAAEREALRGEMMAVQATLRAHSMTEMWAAALLANEKKGLPDYHGVALRRRPADCIASLDALVQAEDLGLVAAAYRQASTMAIRVSLLQLIEGLSLRKFLNIPQGPGAKWGPRDYNEALALLDEWLDTWQDRRCTFDSRRILRNSLNELGVRHIDPLSPTSCSIWVGVLDKGDPRWWGLAGRRLYECGAPPADISILHPMTEDGKNRRQLLLDWHGIEKR